MPISVRLPDDSVREFPDGATGTDLAMSISPRLLDAAFAIRVDGRLQDLGAALPDGVKVAVITSKDPDSLAVVRHSTAHLLAQAVQRLFPSVKVGIGPVIEDGFYYDFLVEKFFTPEDLETIEAEMRRISAEGVPVVREVLEREEAIRRFEAMGEPFKVELVSELPAGETISGDPRSNVSSPRARATTSSTSRGTPPRT